MAVEARLSLFPSQLIGGGNINNMNNREMMNVIESNVSFYHHNNNTSQFEYGGGGLPPLSGTTTENLLPVYGTVVAESVPAIKAESGLSYALPPPATVASRKRPRDSSFNQFVVPYVNNGQIQNHHHHQINSNNGIGVGGGFTFLGEDISYQIQQQQIEIDQIIAQHTEKVRREIEERRRRHSRRIIAAVEEGVMKKLRVKEEEMEKIGKLNYALEERVRSLCVENQIWRELAHTNQATANALRSNLEQVISQVQQNNRCAAGTLEAPADLADDAESCCGSNFNDDDRCGGERNAWNSNDDCTGGATTSGGGGPSRLCRQCGKGESCVLLLPCRHLCLCTVCGSSVHICPVCNSARTASVHVNMSSSG